MDKLCTLMIKVSTNLYGLFIPTHTQTMSKLKTNTVQERVHWRQALEDFCETNLMLKITFNRSPATSKYKKLWNWTTNSEIAPHMKWLSALVSSWTPVSGRWWSDGEPPAHTAVPSQPSPRVFQAPSKHLDSHGFGGETSSSLNAASSVHPTNGSGQYFPALWSGEGWVDFSQSAKPARPGSS